MSNIRPTFIVGNWKMYKTIVEARIFISSLAIASGHCSAQVGLAVPFTMIAGAADVARGTPIFIGAQNVFDEPEGAFTGEISCAQLKDAGASFVIVGHSERRRLFQEDDAWINRKVKSALAGGLRVILCIGETLEQHEAGQTHEVLAEQLTNCLKELAAEQLEHLVVAYEPVWAIGTGLSASQEVAQSAHAFCRKMIGELKGAAVAERLLIIYGGSVKPSNAAALLAQSDIDGLLVGGASLTVDSFAQIIQCKYENITI